MARGGISTCTKALIGLLLSSACQVGLLALPDKHTRATKEQYLGCKRSLAPLLGTSYEMFGRYYSRAAVDVEAMCCSVATLYENMLQPLTSCIGPCEMPCD